MIVELSPAVLLSFITVLAVLGTKLWSLGARIEVTATRDEMKDREAALRKDFEIIIKDRSKDSVQEHANLASKSALTKLESNMLELEKELRNDVKELRESMDAKFEKSHQSYTVMVDLLTKINHYVTPRGK
jgi:hypothetical protein